MGDLNVRFGSQRLGIIKGTNGEQTINSNGGKKLTGLCCFTEFRNFPKQRYLQIYVASPKHKNSKRL